MVRHPGHRWISQDGKAIACLCLLASWFLSRDVAVHSGVRRSISPGTSVLQVPQENGKRAWGRPWRHDNCRRDGLAKPLRTAPPRARRHDSRRLRSTCKVRLVVHRFSTTPLNRFHFFQRSVPLRLCD
jgi:hypothetical protein